MNKNVVASIVICFQLFNLLPYCALLAEAEAVSSADQTSGGFKEKIARYAKAPYTEALFLGQWGAKKIRHQATTQQEDNRAKKDMKIMGAVAALMGTTAFALHTYRNMFLPDVKQKNNNNQSTVPDRKWYWTPWRYEWDKKSRVPGAMPDGCVFCQKLTLNKNDLDDTNPDKYFIVQRFDNGTVLVTNANPYGTGHLMLIPADHIEKFTDLKGDALYEWSIVRNWTGPILQKIYKMEGHNTGINFGKIAGQSVKHIHEHILVRATEGFTGPVGNIRVIGETPDQTYQRVAVAFQNLYKMLHDKREAELSLTKLVPE